MSSSHNPNNSVTDNIMSEILTDTQSRIRLITAHDVKYMTAVRSALQQNISLTAKDKKSNEPATKKSDESQKTAVTDRKSEIAVTTTKPKLNLSHSGVRILKPETKILSNITAATIQNQKLKVCGLSHGIYRITSDFLTLKDLNALNNTCREFKRLFQNTLADENQKIRLRTLLKDIIDAKYDAVYEYIQWGYKFQWIRKTRKIPEVLEKDVLYIRNVANTLQYSIRTSEGACFKKQTITAQDLTQMSSSMQLPLENPVDLKSYNIKAFNELRFLIIAITKKRKHTLSKNNFDLLTREGQITDDVGHVIQGMPLEVCMIVEDYGRESNPNEGIDRLLIEKMHRLPQGKEEIAKQLERQHQRHWEDDAKERHEVELKELNHVKNVFNTYPNDSKERVVAIKEFQNAIMPKKVITSGKCWNSRLFFAALKPKDDGTLYDPSYYHQVVGFIQKIAPKNYRMWQAQGLRKLFKIYSSHDKQEFFNRSLKYRYMAGDYVSLATTPGFRLGIDSWVDSYAGCGAQPEINEDTNDHVYIAMRHLCHSKTAAREKLYSPQTNFFSPPKTLSNDSDDTDYAFHVKYYNVGWRVLKALEEIPPTPKI